MTIEAIREQLDKPAFDVGRLQEQTTKAIESLRLAIAQLRLTQTEEVTALALGFVAGRGGPSSRPPED